MNHILAVFYDDWLPWIVLGGAAMAVAVVLAVTLITYGSERRDDGDALDRMAAGATCHFCRPGGSGRCTCTSVCMDYPDCVGDYTTRHLFSDRDLRWLRRQKIGAGE